MPPLACGVYIPLLPPYHPRSTKHYYNYHTHHPLYSGRARPAFAACAMGTSWTQSSLVPRTECRSDAAHRRAPRWDVREDTTRVRRLSDLRPSLRSWPPSVSRPGSLRAPPRSLGFPVLHARRAGHRLGSAEVARGMCASDVPDGMRPSAEQINVSKFEVHGRPWTASLLAMSVHPDRDLFSPGSWLGSGSLSLSSSTFPRCFTPP